MRSPIPHWEEPLDLEYDSNEPAMQAKGYPAVTMVVKSEKSMQRLKDGTACMQCGAPLPERPCLLNLKVFERVGLESFALTATMARDRIKLGQCPICAFPCGPEMFDKMFSYSPSVSVEIDDPHEWIAKEKAKQGW